MQMKLLATLLRHLCELRIIAIKTDILWNSSWLIIYISVHKPSFGEESLKTLKSCAGRKPRCKIKAI